MTLLVTEVAGRFAASGTDDPNPLDRLTDQPLDWHRSFRYFRLAQTTDDTFDAFRNLFLALESALGYIRPMQEMFDGKREPEGVWLRAALNTVAQRISLEQFARPGNGNPESRIFNEIYKTRRNPVFHAKSIRNPFLPGEYRDRIALAESLRRLRGLYLAFATAYLGLRHPQSEGVLSIMLQGLMRQDSGLRVYVSDLTEHPDWEVVASRGLEDRVVLLETKRARDLATESAKALYVPFTTSFFAQSPVKELSHLSGITQIWTSEGDEQPVLDFILDGSGLTLGGIAHLEVHLGLRLTQPKWGRDVYTH